MALTMILPAAMRRRRSRAMREANTTLMVLLGMVQ
jgi:hypothetical protein